MPRRRVKKTTVPQAPKPNGYNQELFPNHRAIRRALKRLGYKINLVNLPVPDVTARQFQKDYNLCVIKLHPDWGILKIDRAMGPKTLFALERVLAFSQKMAAQHGVSVDQFWQSHVIKCKPMKPKQGPVGKGKAFVEILGNKMGRLRRVDGDFRVYIEKLAKKGKLLFAKVTIPPQVDHRGDRVAKWYPAIAR